MSYLKSVFEQIPGMQFTDFLDIIVVAFLIYKLLPIFRMSGTGRIAWTVVAVLVATWATKLLRMHTMSFLLGLLVEVGLIAIVVLFQPELRRTLDHVSKMKLKGWLGTERAVQEMVAVIEQTTRACEVMGLEKVGALIVFERDNSLEEYFKTGTILDAHTSEQLLRNVFFPRASLHDGAVIIRDGRVAAAGCVLPLSNSQRLHADLGTRHRAAVGISEVSDAVVVVVSEETGVISVAVGGVLKRHLAPQMLERLLRNELCPVEEKQEENLVVKLRQKLQKKGKGDKTNEK